MTYWMFAFGFVVTALACCDLYLLYLVWRYFGWAFGV